MSLETQAGWPALEYEVLHNFALDAEFRARVAAYHGGYWYVGAQSTCVAADLTAWDFWRFGRWRGPAPLRMVPADLSVSGMTLDESIDGAPVARIATGEGIYASCGRNYADGISAYSIESRLYSPTGVLTTSTAAGTAFDIQAWPLPEMTPGSWTLWVRFDQVQTELLTEAEYEVLTGVDLALEYEYVEDGQSYFWDWRRNLGRLPLDPAHPFYASRRALELAGATLDRPEWAAYINSPTSQTGEWSMLRIQVGAGEWTASLLDQISPGPALYRKATPGLLADPMNPVPFDPAARSVSAATIARDGRLLIAGNRASRSGPELALWQYDGTAWTLLGLNANLSNGLCECALSSHDCGSVLEASDGTFYVLSKCSLHRFHAAGVTLEERLPDYPLATGGHPGGQCLQEQGALFWLTEYFGATVAAAAGTAQFYNTLESLSLQGQRRSGTGTAYHGPNAMTSYRGGLWGVVQDLPFAQEAARQRLAVLSGQAWNQSPPDWPAAAYQMQNLESAQGLLVVCGVERDSELPVAAVLDPGGADGDGALQFARFPFRAERLTRIVIDGHEEILAVGKCVTDPDADLDAIPYSLVRLPWTMGTPFTHFCLEWNTEDGFAIELASLPAAVQAAAAPLYLRYQPAAGGPGLWIPSATAPAEPYLQRNITSTHLEYIIHGAMPYSVEGYDKICFTVDGSGGNGSEGGGGWSTGPGTPETSDDNGQDALDDMPDGTKAMVVRVNLSQPWWAVQIDDAHASQILARNLKNWPACWLCLDPAADVDDFTAYTVPIRRVNDNGRLNLPRTLAPADGPIRALFLWPPLIDGSSYEVQSYAISPVE